MLVEQITGLLSDYCFWWTVLKDNFILFVIFTVVISFLNYFRYLNSLPPGPWGLPFLGYIPFMTPQLHRQYKKMAEKYGPIFCVNFGCKPVVILANHDTIREAFNRSEFAGRPNTPFIGIMEGYGVINAEGPLWKNERKFLSTKFKQFGAKMMNNHSDNLELVIKREVDTLLRYMARHEFEPIHVSSPLSLATTNVISYLVMGKRFTDDEFLFQRFMNLTTEGFRLFSSLTMANYVPAYRIFPGTQKIKKKIQQNREEMSMFFEEVIKEHRQKYDSNNLNDIVDTYLYEIEKVREKGEENFEDRFEGRDVDRHLQQIMGDLFSAGMETVKTTLEWGIFFMLHHPNAARAVQNELDQVVGRSRLPNLQDMDQLPLTKATIQEILRKSSVVPLGAPHATTRSTTFQGYHIPANSEVISLIYAVHNDPEIWGDPEVFRPERFIKSDGKIDKPPKYLMPFGVGQRICLGEKLARYELFLFFSSLLHTFNIRLPEGASLPSIEDGILGTTFAPQPFKICLQMRDSILIDGNANNEFVRNVGA
ncbi:hypothetical protein P5V15_005937 [Pogonomyrmex californicus]